MAGLADVQGDRNTWEAARELGKQLKFPVGPYEARVPTADEMNAVLPYLMDRMARFAADKYFCENAEITFSHVLGINVPRQGFPDSSGYNYKSGLDWEGYNRDGYDREGYNREGLDYRGFDRNGYNKDGFDRRGYDKDGYNVEGRDHNGHTREEAAVALVNGWSKQHLAAMKSQLTEMGLLFESVSDAAKDVAASTEAATAAVKKATRATKAKAAPKTAAPKKVAARRRAPNIIVTA